MNEILEKTLLLDFYGKLLTDKQREMFAMKYEDDMSLTEIAEEYNITRQGVSEAIKNAEKTLLEYESKLMLVKRFKSLELIIEKIDKVVDSVTNEENKKQLNMLKKELEEIRKWNNGI